MKIVFSEVKQKSFKMIESVYRIVFILIFFNTCTASFQQNHSFISTSALSTLDQSVQNSSNSENVHYIAEPEHNVLLKNRSKGMLVTENFHFRNEINSKLRFEIESYLRKFSFIYGLTVTANDDDLPTLKHLNVNPTCLGDLKMIKSGIDNNEIWAKKLMDSSGTYRSGFILGNNYWMGSKKGCDAINHKLTVTLSNRFNRVMVDNLLEPSAPIKVNFRMVHANHNSPWQLEMQFLGEGILHLGLCVPQSCSDSEIKNLSQYAFSKKSLQLQNVYEIQPNVTEVKNLQLSTGFFNKFTVKLFIFLFIVTITLTICGAYVPSDQTSNLSLFERVVKCFSIKDNFNDLVKTDTTTSTISVINGLRSIACFWIITPHINWFMHYTLDNEATYFDYAEKFLYQPLTNAPILVDLFFAISGFLLAYNFLRNRRQMHEIKGNSLFKNIKLFSHLLFKRFVRLSPPYYLILLIVEIATSLLVDVSYFYIHERNDLLFEKYWWRNLLYIQNFFEVNDMMASWTWSLACEMQYFVLFTIILFVYVKNPDQGIKLFTSVWFIAFIATFGSALYHNFNFSFDVWYATRSALYMAPWARVHPYFIGILSAYYLKRNDGKIGITKTNRKTLWIAALSIAAFCLYSSAFRDLHFILSSIGLLAQRISIGIPAMWLIIASITGNGNWFTKFLGFRWFVHINKLSYGIYLINPIVIIVIYGLRDSPSHTDVITTVAMTTAIGFIVYILAIVFSLLCDMPYNRLSDEFIKMDSRKLPAKDL